MQSTSVDAMNVRDETCLHLRESNCYPLEFDLFTLQPVHLRRYTTQTVACSPDPILYVTVLISAIMLHHAAGHLLGFVIHLHGKFVPGSLNVSRIGSGWRLQVPMCATEVFLYLHTCVFMPFCR